MENYKASQRFKGRIIQVLEAISSYDAVSNQAFHLDSIFKKIGFNSEIYAFWRDDKTERTCLSINELTVKDNDIIIYHYSGFAKHTTDKVLHNNCTRILLYHNITPATFFRKDSPLLKHCENGRAQLNSIIKRFHFYWADSQYNLDELIELGAPVKFTSIIPIVVDTPKSAPNNYKKIQGNWIFVGRISENKNHIDLINTFVEINKTSPQYAQHLTLIGGYDKGSSYYKELKNLIAKNDAQSLITITGKVNEGKIEEYFAASEIYVSCSQHEGFGVPLVESPLRGTPVVAIKNTAVGETMGNSKGLVNDLESMKNLIICVLSDKNKYEDLVIEQRNNAKRFNVPTVQSKIIEALTLVFPKNLQFESISFVICTYNRKLFLERCLDYLSIQTNQNYEVIVVNGPSTDGTTEYLDEVKDRIKVIQNPVKNLSISRNLGIENASGDIVAFIDDDAIPFADWVENTLEEFNSRPLTFAAIGGPVFFAGTLKYQIEDIGFNQLAEVIPNIESNKIGKDGLCRSLLGTNCAFKKEILYDVGGFDEQYDYFLDESDLTFRIQQKNHIVGYSENLQLRHEFAISNNRKDKFSYNWFSICKNEIYFIRKYSGLSGGKLEQYCRTRINRERVQPLIIAAQDGELSQELCEVLIKQVWNGYSQGVDDSRNELKTRSLQRSKNPFKKYHQSETASSLANHKRLHICIISKEFPPFSDTGGVGTLYYHLASELLILGHKVTVITAGERDERFKQGNFSVQFLEKKAFLFRRNQPANSENLSWSLQIHNSAWQIHQETPIDIFDSALWDTEALALSLIESEKRPPIILRMVTPFSIVSKTNDWDIPNDTFNQYKSAERHLLENADMLIPISNSISDTIQSEHNLKKDRKWVYNRCGITHWPLFKVNSNYDKIGNENIEISSLLKKYSKTFLFIGRLEKRKGIDTLLEAAKEFLLLEDVALIIGGNDPDNWKQKFYHQIEPSAHDKLLFLGKISDSLREKLFAHTFCLLFPSKYESFGLVPLEAYVHCLPIIASRAGAIPEVVEDNVSGLLFEPDNPSDLVRMIKKLTLSIELHTRLIKGANLKRKYFSSKSSALESTKIYHKAIKRSKYHN